MNTQEMKAALAKTFDDAWHRRDMDAAYEIYSDDVVFQRFPFPPIVGKAANLEADAAMLAAFTETRCILDEVIVEGDTAAVRWTWDAVHTGTSPALGIPPTGKRVILAGCSVYRFQAGKVVEQWEYSDMLGLLQQVGVIPALG